MRWTVLLCFLLPGINYSIHAQTFDRRYDLGELSVFWSVENIDSNYCVSGAVVHLDSVGTPFEIPIVVSVNSFGDTAWTHEFPGASYAIARRMIETQDGNLLVTGFWQLLDSSGGGSHYYDSDIFLAKMDRLGNVIWQTIYSHPSDTSLVPSSLAEGNNGNIYVSGLQYNWQNDLFSSFIYEFDSTGNYFQHTVFSNPLDNANVGLLLAHNKYYISGTDYYLNIDADPILMSVDSNTKTLTWMDSLWTPSGMDFGCGLDSALDGNIVWTTTYCNSSSSNPPLAVRVLKVDTLGTIIWSYTSNVISSGGGSYYCRPTNDSGYIFSASLKNIYLPASTSDGYLVKLNAQGDSVWGMKFDHGSIDNFFDVQQTSDSGFVMCGESYAIVSGNLKSLAWLVKVDHWGCIVSGCNPLGIREPEDSELLDVFPNPFQDYVTFLTRQQPRIFGKKAILKIYDLLGRELLSANLLESKTIINLSSLAKGCFVAVLITDKDKFVRKLIKSN